MDYSILYKENFNDLSTLSDSMNWDLFISAYNPSDRVCEPQKKVDATLKVWVMHEEYEIKRENYPTGYPLFEFPVEENEAENIKMMFNDPRLKNLTLDSMNICLDATGFMRPTLMYLLLYLIKVREVKSLDVIYSEPKRYAKKEKTVFSKSTTGKVKSVDGFELASGRDHSNDLLIIGSGFDKALIAEVAEAKKHAKIVQLIGFPSLQADMYQQNLFQVSQVDEVSMEDVNNIRLSPASDPFETAKMLRQIVADVEKETGRNVTNLYLSPISTKAQVIGFALYFILECIDTDKNVSVIIPQARKYAEVTGEGISNTWLYKIEIPH